MTVAGTLPNNYSLTLFGVFVAQNLLTGTIPSALCALSNLRYLYAGDNFFTGKLPPVLANASALVALDLNSNALHGPLSRVFTHDAATQFPILNVLVLTGNKLR